MVQTFYLKSFFPRSFRLWFISFVANIAFLIVGIYSFVGCSDKASQAILHESERRSDSLLSPELHTTYRKARQSDEHQTFMLHFGGLWQEQTILIASDGVEDDRFGFPVAIDGDTAVIGAWSKKVGHNVSQGQAYVFVRNGSTWSEQAKLVASDGAQSDNFGYSVAINGDTIVIGAYLKSAGSTSYQGQAYVFVRNGSTWSEQAKLAPSDGAVLDQFGRGVAISGDIAVVGAPLKEVGSNRDQGQVYVFVRHGTTWSEQARLSGSDGTADDFFGYATAISGDTILIGAYGKLVGPMMTNGKTYVFVRRGSMWLEQAQLVPSDGEANDYFGYSVALNKDTAIIGAYLKSVGGNRNQGQAYVFVRSGSAWLEQAKLTSSDGAIADNFAFSVAIDRDIAVIGTPSKKIGTVLKQGQAYVFKRSGSSWIEQDKFTGSDSAASSYFGNAVGISGNTILVGASNHSVMGSRQGQVHAFIKSDGATHGTSCSADFDCLSNFCIDGVCCDGRCGEGVVSDCLSCLGRETGAADGICSVVSSTSRYTCRSSTALCDKPEMCDGVKPACPKDELYQAADKHICRAATECSSPSYCDGTSSSCPLTFCGASSF